MFWRLDPKNLKPGQMVDGWRIVRKIGGGSYAVVYEVEKGGKRFALKVACQVDTRGDPKQTDARARREVVCLQKLDHPHIIRMWAHGRCGDPRSGFLYVVLDLVDGYTLGEWVRRTYPTVHEDVVVFLKLFDALEHMHGRGVFHRDLSLRNIMVTKEGEPVVIDFGAADYADAEELTDAQVPPCTPRNRSPEAVRFWRENLHNPEARYTFQATDDIFALGADLYDVLTDPTPDLSKNRPSLQGLVAPASPFKVTQGRVPLDLSTYAMMLLHPSLKERPATAKDARRPLEDFAKCEGPEWRDTRPHPVAAQLPPEPAEGVPAPVEEEQPGGVEVPIPAHPSAVQGAGVAALNSARLALRRPALVGLLALVVLAAAVAASLLHRSAPAAPFPMARSAPAEQPPPAPALAEKPTSRPAQLPSSHPTQKEASPSVRLPENSPTLTNGVPNPQKASPRRVLSKVERCALLLFTLAWVEAGCTGVQTRPDPETCPKDAVDAMEKELGWSVGYQQPAIVVDLTKGGTPHPLTKVEDAHTVFKDGPVTGELAEDEGKAQKGTRLEGHLWTTGDRIYGRYRRAHLPGGRTVPICVELISGGNLGLDKQEGSKPGAAVGSKEVNGLAVERWR
ncbi:serine/threonine protein kinase [Hyalangium versicolor]|uniref:serine/threonine protein kinase n=1 Tax=Hyalangium versicolor TaxID=2861190 RepID=UPI001CCACEC1|nr:serine/threonine-protein kinase [Hyalangium versicolor]